MQTQRKTRRAHFEWCPHGTFNPLGCGVCKSYRDSLCAAKRDGVREERGAVVEWLRAGGSIEGIELGEHRMRKESDDE